MSRRVTRHLWFTAAAGLLVAGCSSGSSADPPTTEAGAASPAASTTTLAAAPSTTNATATTTDRAATPEGMRTVAADRFAVSIPEAWQALLLDETGTVTPERAGDAPPSQQLEQLGVAAALQGAGLLSVADGTASSNLMVIALGAEESAADATLTDGFRARLAESGVTDMTVEMVDLPAGRAVSARYTQTLDSPGGAVTNDVASAYIAGSTTSWLLTLTVPSGAPELATFDDIARSFAPA